MQDAGCILSRCPEGRDWKTPFARLHGKKPSNIKLAPSLLYPEGYQDGNGKNHIRKVYASPRPPPRISLKHDWMKELVSEVALQAEGSQPTQPNPNPNHDRRGRPVVCENTSRSSAQEIDTRFSRDCKNANLEEEAIHERTGRPVVSGQPISSSSTINEVDIDFRISGLPHSVVKQAENSRVRELVKEIENHPHRQDLQADLQQNKAYNPFTTMTKQMIQDVGNVELFELFETDPKTQCTECLSYWSGGVVHCTCGHLFKEIAANRGVIEDTLDLLPISVYIIKKGRPHGHRYGKNPEQKEYHLAHNLKKRCIMKNFKGIHNCFLRDPEFRTAMLEHDRDEEVCIKMDDLADKEFLS